MSTAEGFGRRLCRCRSAHGHPPPHDAFSEPLPALWPLDMALAHAFGHGLAPAMVGGGGGRGHGGMLGCGGCGAQKGREGQNGAMISTVPPTPLSAEAVLNQFRLHQADWRRRFHVVELGLFGSVARGEARPDSDLDVWVQLDPLTPYALVHLKQELEELLQRPVDLVRLRDRMAPTLRQRIESEGLKA